MDILKMNTKPPIMKTFNANSSILIYSIGKTLCIHANCIITKGFVEVADTNGKVMANLLIINQDYKSVLLDLPPAVYTIKLYYGAGLLVKKTFIG